jgi:hypothetical protein
MEPFGAGPKFKGRSPRSSSGLISATLLTLFVLPALYAWFGRDSAKAEAVDDRISRAAE